MPSISGRSCRLFGARGRFDRGFGKALGERVDLRCGKGFGFHGLGPSGVDDVGGMAEGSDRVDRVHDIRQSTDWLTAAPFRGNSHADLLPSIRHPTIDQPSIGST